MMKKLRMKLMLLLVLVIVGVMYSPKQETFAAGTPVKICAVSYTDESILVFTNGNSKIYYATELDAARNNWDVIEVTDDIAVIDISWLSTNVENFVVIKGDKDGAQSRVVINQRPLKLQVSINYSQLDSLAPDDNIGEILNIMSSVGTANAPINFDDLQWRKGEDGRWMSSDLLTKRVLENYLIRGANLYFRVAPVDDIISATPDISDDVMNYLYTPADFSTVVFDTEYPDGSKGRRASSAVKLKIAKQVTLPVTGVDGAKFTVNIKYGQEYRITTTVSGSSVVVVDWTKVTDRAITKMPIATMLKGTSDGLTTSFPEMLIEIRNYSTSKASSSKITETHLNAQRILPGTIKQEAAPTGVTAADQNIYITYNGTKNINIQIPSATGDNPYEYCVVKDGSSLDLARASWTAITKGTLVKVTATKAVDLSTVYIRQKEIKYRAESLTKSAVAFKLASTIQTFKVVYPSMPVAPKTTYVFTKGYTTSLAIEVTLNEAGKVPFETELNYIKLGTKDIPIVGVPTISPAISGSNPPSTVYKMTINLDCNALKDMPNSTGRALTIFYKNGTVDKTSSKLTIKNPTDALALTTNVAVGSVNGTTKVTLLSSQGAGNKLVYEITSTQITGKKMEDLFTGTQTTFTSGMDIAITADQYLTIYELDANNYIMKYKSIQIKAADIKQP